MIISLLERFWLRNVVFRIAQIDPNYIPNMLEYSAKHTRQVFFIVDTTKSVFASGFQEMAPGFGGGMSLIFKHRR